MLQHVKEAGIASALQPAMCAVVDPAGRPPGPISEPPPHSILGLFAGAFRHRLHRHAPARRPQHPVPRRGLALSRRPRRWAWASLRPMAAPQPELRDYYRQARGAVTKKTEKENGKSPVELVTWQKRPPLLPIPSAPPSPPFSTPARTATGRASSRSPAPPPGRQDHRGQQPGAGPGGDRPPSPPDRWRPAQAAVTRNLSRRKRMGPERSSGWNQATRGIGSHGGQDGLPGPLPVARRYGGFQHLKPAPPRHAWWSFCNECGSSSTW